MNDGRAEPPDAPNRLAPPVPMPPFEVAFRRLLAVRLAGTVCLRFSYPFIATIADGLGVGISTIGLAIACGEAAGMLGPLMGRRLDRIGRQRGMADGLIVAAIGCAMAAATPNAAGLGLALFFIAAGRFFFDVSFGAWVGDEVPFTRRGRINGVSELSWSGSFFIGVPIAGLLTSVSSWRAPYAVSAVMLLAFIPVIRHNLAAAKPTAPASGRSVAARPSALHAAIVLSSFGAALIFVTEGAWFVDDLGFTDRAVSLAVIALGVGEIVGTLLSATFADRQGKVRTMRAGIAVLFIAVAGIALAGTSQPAGVMAALLVGVGFELAFVSALPLIVEVAEERRASALGLAVAALTMARTVAAVAGTALYDEHGIGIVVAVSLPALLVAGAVTARVREPAHA